MVTEGVPTPVYTLVTVPSEETTATAELLEVQVMVPVPPVRVAVSERVWEGVKIPEV